MNSLADTLRSLGLMKLGIIATLLVGIGSGLYFVGQKFSEPDMALLYSELDMADASKIISRIEGLGIPVELRGAGTQIYVPADKVARLRMDMAEAGLPRGGSVGYEIFDKSEALGTTGFVQDINHLRALEGELSRSISSLTHVESARVHLVLPRRELFSRDKSQPSASIILKISGPGRLPNTRVQSIQHLVASAVPNLSPERVSVIDDKGNLLARGDSSSEAASASNLEEMKLNYETRISQTIENISEKYVGMGKVRAEVTAEIDFDRVTENTEKYDPEGQVLRSSQTIEEGENASEAGSSKDVGVQNNLPNAPAGAAGNNSSQSKKTEETLNYEISKSQTTHVKETGGLKRLSVAVMVDGTYAKDAQGKEVYTPRPPAEMEQLKKLIASAIGFNSERKDQLEVMNMRFAPFDLNEGIAEKDTSLFGFSRHEIIKLVETIIFGILGLLTLLLVVRPLINRILNSLALQTSSTSNTSSDVITGGGTQSPPALENQRSSQAALSSPSNPQNSASEAGSDNMLENSNMEPSAIEQMISMKKVEGKLRASSIEKVGAIIDERPDDAVTIVRNWMYEAN